MVKVQVFTDFDGTLSLHDTGILLIDDHRSMGTERRKVLDHAILVGKKTYREAVQAMWDEVHLTWEEACAEHLDVCEIDPGFPGFFEYCRENNFPVTVVSSGIIPVLERVMTRFLGEKAKEIEIVANKGKIEGRDWHIIWRDDTPFGNDKSKTLIKAREEADEDTVFVFCGDGVSDISAAKHADILFARNGRDLVTYCEREKIPFIGFDTFDTVKEITQQIVEGKLKLVKDQATGFYQIAQ